MVPQVERTGIRLGAARFRLWIFAWMPDARERDLDNILKPILDTLQKGLVYENDSQIDDLRPVRMEIDRKRPRVECFLWTLEDGWQHDLYREACGWTPP